MAKSLRSKWKRKMRAVKRERYGKKELEKLKLVIETATSSENEIPDHTTLVKVVNKSQMTRKVDEMEIDDVKNTDILNTGKNSFPVWMSSHRKKKIIRSNKKLNKQKKKLLKKEKKKYKR